MAVRGVVGRPLAFGANDPSLAAIRFYLDARPELTGVPHLAWTTGGALLPGEDFDRLLA